MNDIERHVLEIIGENTTSPDVFLDTDAGLEPIRDSINDAVQEIVMLTGSYKRSYYIPLQTNQTFYRIKYTKGSFGWVTDAWLIGEQRRLTQTDLIKLNKYNPRWLEDTGSPDEYFQIGEDVIGFYRKPGGNSDAIELKAVVIPERYKTSSERIHLTNTYKWACVHYAVSEYYASRGDAREALNWLEKYINAIKLDYSFNRVRTYQTTKDELSRPTQTY